MKHIDDDELVELSVRVAGKLESMEDIKMDRKQPQKKKFVRYKEGAELYSMCQSKFEQLAKEAKATYKVDQLPMFLKIRF